LLNEITSFELEKRADEKPIIRLSKVEFEARADVLLNSHPLFCKISLAALRILIKICILLKLK
jgi:hypothetical protein